MKSDARLSLLTSGKQESLSACRKGLYLVCLNICPNVNKFLKSACRIKIRSPEKSNEQRMPITLIWNLVIFTHSMFIYDVTQMIKVPQFR